jgi:hypothetical protein
VPLHERRIFIRRQPYSVRQYGPAVPPGARDVKDNHVLVTAGIPAGKRFGTDVADHVCAAAEVRVSRAVVAGAGMT